MGVTQSKKKSQQKWGKHTRSTYKKQEKKARNYSFIPKLQEDQQKKSHRTQESNQLDGKNGHMDLFRSFSAPAQMELNPRKLPRVTRLMSVHESTGQVVELYWSPKREINKGKVIRGKSSASSVLRRSGLADKNDCRELADEFQNKLLQISRWSGIQYNGNDTLKQQVKFKHIQKATDDLQSQQQSIEDGETKC
jgi:hypothetical protein